MIHERNSADSTIVSTLLVTTVALMAFGLVMVATATVAPDRPLIRDVPWTGYFARQVIFSIAGLALLIVMPVIAGPSLSRPNVRFKVVVIVAAIVALTLLLAFVPGFADPRRGSHRWLSLAPLGINSRFQPSEFAKPALVLVLATLLTRADPRSFKMGLLPAALAIGFCVALVGAEDFGTSALLAGTGAAMLLAAGCRWRVLALIGAAGLVGMIGLIYAEPYRLERITAFQNIWTDAQGAAYQPHQSLMTIASGGWFGRGLGAGVQKYGYLPEAQTDFIFAVICEETGIVGAMLYTGLVGALAWCGVRIVRAARTPFARLTAMGLTVSIVLQALLNMAVVTVLTPTTGISLPFVSAGGSGLLSACVTVGLLCALARDGNHRSEPVPVASGEAVTPPVDGMLLAG